LTESTFSRGEFIALALAPELGLVVELALAFSIVPVISTLCPMCALICESSTSSRYVLPAAALVDVDGVELVAPGAPAACVSVNFVSFALPDVPVAPFVPDGAIARSTQPVIVILLLSEAELGALGRCAGEV